MRFFTPELLLAYGSDDTAVWRNAEARWDEALEGYAAHLTALRGRMPGGLCRLVDEHRLHDAQVRAMGARDGEFVVLLQLDAPGRPLLSLTYELVAPPEVNSEALAVELRSTAEVPEWQYDELEMTASEPLTWRQSVLLSNGWEVTLHFRNVRVEELRPLIPAGATNGAACQVVASPLA